MPGPEKTASTPVIAYLMESHALSEEDLFAPRQEEIPRIQNGSVTLIPVEDKQRVLDLMQEVIRLRIEVGKLSNRHKRRIICTVQKISRRRLSLRLHPAY